MSRTDRIEVEVEAGFLQRILISNLWQKDGTAEDLAQAISHAIKQALPEEAPVTSARPGRPDVRSMTINELREYMAMHRDYSRNALEFSRRAARGEFRGDAAPVPAEEGQNVEIRFKEDRFDEVLINPQWAEKATANSIMDAVLRAFEGVQLVGEGPASRELAALRAERARIRDFAQA